MQSVFLLFLYESPGTFLFGMLDDEVFITDQFTSLITLLGVDREISLKPIL